MRWSPGQAISTADRSKARFTPEKREGGGNPLDLAMSARETAASTTEVGAVEDRAIHCLTAADPYQKPYLYV